MSTRVKYGILAIALIAVVSFTIVGITADANDQIDVVKSFDSVRGEFPEGIAIDKAGNIYVTLGAPAFAGGGLGEVWKFSPDGTETILAACEPPRDLPSPQYKSRVEKNVMIPMRDGVKLAANIYFPQGADQAPVILVRLPYGKDKMADMFNVDLGTLSAQQGYTFIIQDVRGRYKSDGDFYPFAYEDKDGVDTIAWIRDQHHGTGRSDGHVHNCRHAVGVEEGQCADGYLFRFPGMGPVAARHGV